METFSVLLAICAGNSPVSGEFPAQRPVIRSFDVFFDLRMNEWLSKHSWGWWLEMSTCPLWSQSNEMWFMTCSIKPKDALWYFIIIADHKQYTFKCFQLQKFSSHYSTIPTVLLPTWHRKERVDVDIQLLISYNFNIVSIESYGIVFPNLTFNIDLCKSHHFMAWWTLGTRCLGTHFTNILQSHCWNVVKILFAPSFILTFQSCHNFGHVMTAELSWHVQNFDMIW